MRTLLRLSAGTMVLATVLGTPVLGTAPPPLTPFHFGPATVYPLPNAVTRLAAGDLNGDSLPELVVLDPFDNKVRVLLNQGNGTFGPPAEYNVASIPMDVAFGDVNNDGRTDVVVAPFGGVRVAPGQSRRGIAVLLGNGDGTLQPQIFSQLDASLTSGGGPRTIALGDMNGDGWLDAVSQRYAPGDVSEIAIALGDGTGAFTVSARVAGGASEVHLADFDRDGHLDVFANDMTVSPLYPGTGAGTLLPGTAVYSHPAQMDAADVGDLNGDGLLDIALTTDPPDPNDPETLVTRLGNGDGTFGAPIVLPLAGERSLTTRIADMDGDGNSDVVIIDDVADAALRLRVLLGNGDGTFKTPFAYALADAPSAFDLADLDGNGLPDVALTTFTTVTVVLDGGDRTAPILTLPAPVTT
jgi:hypothetical protein